jgi:glycosyltransferase involved in cell wall biosynthesis
MLALVSSGAVEELLKKTRAGFPIPPDDTRRVAEALKDLYQRRNQPLSKATSELRSEISQYSRRNLTVQLARELNDLAAHRANENR